jgi:hypothetical protein
MLRGGTGAEIPQPTKGFALMRILRCFAATSAYASVCYMHFTATEYLQWQVWGRCLKIYAGGKSWITCVIDLFRQFELYH